MDVFTPRERSQIMSRVKSRGNHATESRLVKIFRDEKITGWRRQYPIFGKPDFVFPARRLVVFVDGCFWHSCPKHKSQPMTNFDFWKQKLYRNRVRDKLVTKNLRSQGWRVVRIWQHELRGSAGLPVRLSRALAIDDADH